MKEQISIMKRGKSLNALKRAKNTPMSSLAEKNIVSLKQPDQRFYLNRPLRLILPDYFNIPKFNDKGIDFSMSFNPNSDALQSFRQQKGLKKKLRDLSILAEGMKRSKNIKQESRYYFIQAVILNNAGMWQKSIQMFQKFLKIVLFIKDDKSIELALNSIAICYMYLNKPEQALQYHEKQTYLNDNTQYFIGRINIGLCKQMVDKKSQAHQIYCDLADNITNLNQRKLQFLEKLIERTKYYKARHYFLTQDNRNTKHQSKIHHKSKQSQKQNLPELSSLHIGNQSKSIPRKKPQKMLNHSFSSRKYDCMKVKYAIFSAQEHLTNYLSDMKHSFIQQN